jgi:hypothetical protein
MQCLIRMRVFLLCCLLVISANVMLIMSGFVDAGTRQGGAVVRPGCDAPVPPRESPAGSRYGMP